MIDPLFDVVSFGEAMICLSAPPNESLESAAHFTVHAAGAEVNVVVTLARMGFRTGWVSKLPADALGRRVAAEMRRHSVDMSAIVWAAASGRTGLYFVEHAPPPRGVTVHYDRGASAFSMVTPDEIDWDYVRSARWAHLTGITPALSDSCARAASRFVQEARAAGRKVSFDVNHRRKLWDAERARATLEPLIHGVDLLVAAQEDAREVFGIHGLAADMATRLRERYRTGFAIITAGADGAYLADGADVHHEPAVPGGEVDRIGRGDAFTAGVLWGMLEGDLRAGLRYGVALAALAQTYWGDIPWSTRQDVLAALSGRGPEPLR